LSFSVDVVVAGTSFGCGVAGYEGSSLEELDLLGELEFPEAGTKTIGPISFSLRRFSFNTSSSIPTGTEQGASTVPDLDNLNNDVQLLFKMDVKRRKALFKIEPMTTSTFSR